MGGATAFGNTSPAAEFNFLADPEAAEAVLQSGAKITICPLDLSHKSYLTSEEIARLARLGTPQAAFTAAILDSTVEYCQKKFGVPGSIVYDPAALLFALRPELFTTESCWCAVETGGVCCRGKMVTDVFSDAQNPDNATLALEVDRPAFVQAFLELMGRYPL